uniref:65-kDa microtubule-associated protein 1-like n=1 Tax=Rhizophora mucronata TaxID=61149 RepID=A0A2P2JGZ3_RHIMU
MTFQGCKQQASNHISWRSWSRFDTRHVGGSILFGYGDVVNGCGRPAFPTIPPPIFRCRSAAILVSIHGQSSAGYSICTSIRTGAYYLFITNWSSRAGS